MSSIRVRDPQRVVENRGPPRRLAGDVQGRVETVERNPPDGRHRAAGLYRTRSVSPTTSTVLYENASGLQLTPSKGAQVLTWTAARNSIWGGRRSLYQEYVETSTQNELIRTFHHWCRQRFCELGNITFEGVNNSKGSGATPMGSLARPHGNPTKEYSLHSSASAQMETRGLLSRVSVRGILTDAHNEITYTQIEVLNSTF
jgi:hypothetical protein